MVLAAPLVHKQRDRCKQHHVKSQHDNVLTEFQLNLVSAAGDSDDCDQLLQCSVRQLWSLLAGFQSGHSVAGSCLVAKALLPLFLQPILQ